MSGKTIAPISVPTPSTEDGVLDVQPSAKCTGTSSLLCRTLVQTPMSASPIGFTTSNISELTSFTIERLELVRLGLASSACASGT